MSSAGSSYHLSVFAVMNDWLKRRGKHSVAVRIEVYFNVVYSRSAQLVQNDQDAKVLLCQLVQILSPDPAVIVQNHPGFAVLKFVQPLPYLETEFRIIRCRINVRRILWMCCTGSDQDVGVDNIAVLHDQAPF